MEALNNYARLALCPSSVRATSSERRQLALLNYLETAQLPLTTNPAERKVALRSIGILYSLINTTNYMTKENFQWLKAVVLKTPVG